MSVRTVEIIERRYRVEVFPPDEAPTEIIVDNPQLVDVILVGIQGPPGASGAGFVHNQASAEAEWIVNHNLGFKPAVAVSNTGGIVGIAEVLHVSTNQLRIYFATPTAGEARCV